MNGPLLAHMDKLIDPVSGKSQTVRLLDVFVLGPFMVWYAISYKDAPTWARGLLAFSGLLTTVYNGGNYLRIMQDEIHKNAG